MKSTGAKEAKNKKRITMADVPVDITDDQGHVNHDPATVKKTDQVAWTNNSRKTMEVSFISETPFSWTSRPVSAGDTLYSGQPRGDAKTDYPYHYRVTPENAAQGFDPIVIVQN